MTRVKPECNSMGGKSKRQVQPSDMWDECMKDAIDAFGGLVELSGVPAAQLSGQDVSALSEHGAD